MSSRSARRSSEDSNEGVLRINSIDSETNFEALLLKSSSKAASLDQLPSVAEVPQVTHELNRITSHSPKSQKPNIRIQENEQSFGETPSTST